MRTRPIITTLLVVLMAASASANTVDFDSLITGTTYGASTGYAPGDYVFSEDVADCYVNDFWIGGSPYFNYMRVDLAFAFFGVNNILNINNVSLDTDFTAPGDVVFDYLYLGGAVNLQFDGLATPLVGPDFMSLAGSYGAMTVNVTAGPIGPGVGGQVTITGPVQHLRIGGQELFIDGMTCNNGVSSAVSTCDYVVTYDFVGTYTEFGSTVGMSPGDFAFIEDNIPVFVELFDTGLGLFFNHMRIDPAFPPLGSGDVAMVNNINQRFDIDALGIVTDTVTFEYYDQGGTENISVNGAPLWVGNLHTIPANTFPGVTVSVVPMFFGTDVYGVVTITGNVQELIVGGQEFHMDNVCVAEDVPVDCWHLVDHESLPVYANYGNGYGQAPGDLIFVETNIPVLVETFDSGTGPSFNSCQTMPAMSGMGDGNIMWMNNISNVYDIAATGVAVVEVHFEYLDVGGVENLQVNGAPLYIGDLHLAPTNIAPGVTFSVTTTPIPGGVRAEAKLTGPVDMLLLGGQEFAVDNICVIGDPNTSVGLGLPAPTVTLRPNHPNPFNPSTTLKYSLTRGGQVRLTVHDLKGRAVRTLVADDLPAGDHSVVWDGRNDGGEAVGSGVYFVRVETRDGVAAQKISLIK